MIILRPSSQRGKTQLDWLDSRHSFSFGDYFDPNHMGFGPLRVINEDFVEPLAGFPKHPHRNMEIITVIVSGSLEHKDSMGNGAVIREGEIQYMCAGKGVLHSEFNSSKDQKVHLYQIWIEPNTLNENPAYAQKPISSLTPNEPHPGFTLLVSGSGANGSIKIHQDASLLLGTLKEGEDSKLTLNPGRAGWIQVMTGTLTLNELTLNSGDGASVEKIQELRFRGVAPETTFLVFDL